MTAAVRRVGPVVAGLVVSAGSLAAMAIVLLVGEGTVRLLWPEHCAATDMEAEHAVTSRGYLEPCATVADDGPDAALVFAPRQDKPPRRLPRAKRPGVVRIAVIGESSADLLAVHLAALVETPACAARVEVLNCAQGGSGLEHVERRFDEVLRYQPDAVVLLFGHNIFFRFELDDRTLRLHALRARSCLISWLAPAVPPSEPPALGARLAAFERFLRRAAGMAREAGVVLAVATMPGNLWVPPSAPLGDERFLEARLLEARNRRDEAIRRLEALAAAGGDAVTHFELGEQLARAGEDQRAYRALRRAADDDVLRLRAPSALNTLLRQVAGEERMLLRDTERALEARAPGGMPGWESFIDNCHLQPHALNTEAVALLALLRVAMPDLPLCDPAGARYPEKGLRDVLSGVLALSASGPDDLSEVWYRGLALAVEGWVTRDGHRADREVEAFLATPAFVAAEGDARGTRVLLAIAEGYERAGAHARADALNARARSGGRAAAWVQKALFHLRRGESQPAREAAERALADDPANVEARAVLGVAP